MVRSAHAQESTTKLKKLSLKLAYKIWVAIKDGAMGKAMKCAHDIQKQLSHLKGCKMGKQCCKM